MKPASLAPISARCVSTCRSISRPSTSCSLQPRRNETPCRAAIADESRALASDIDGSPREKRLPKKPIIDGPVARHPADAHRPRAGTAASVECRYRSRRRRAARPSRCEARRAARRRSADVRWQATRPPTCRPPCRRCAARRSWRPAVLRATARRAARRRSGRLVRRPAGRHGRGVHRWPRPPEANHRRR